MVARTIFAISHVPFEDLAILAPLLDERGYNIEYLDAGIDDLTNTKVANADLLVVLGSPIGVGDLDTYPFLYQEIELLLRRIDQRRPVLGICLGAQLIATALGAPVYSSSTVEIGYAPLQLTEDGRQSSLAAIEHTPVLH